jgi:hypothetical protein
LFSLDFLLKGEPALELIVIWFLLATAGAAVFFVRHQRRAQRPILAGNASVLRQQQDHQLPEARFPAAADCDFETELYSPLVGVTRAGREALKRCRVLDRVHLIKQSQKRKGTAAIAVISERGEKLGYLPQHFGSDGQTSPSTGVLWQIEISELCMEAIVLLRNKPSEAGDGVFLHELSRRRELLP